MQINITEIEKVDTKLVLFKFRTDIRVSVTVIEWHGIIDGKITFKTPLETYSLDVYSIVSILGGHAPQVYTALDRFVEHEVYDARLQEIYNYLVRNIIQGCCCDTPSPSAGSFDEVATYGDLPITGLTDVLYYVADEGNFYVWDGAAYFSPDKVITSTASGTDTYTGTGSPTVLDWQENVIYKFRFTNANTGPSTYDLDTVGAVSIVTSTGAALAGGEIPADSIQFLVYDGTDLRLMGGGGGGGVETVTGNVVDNTDPLNPVVTAVASVTGSVVDNTDPQNPVINAATGTVESVTGDSVDNTDPANPIINAIPYDAANQTQDITGGVYSVAPSTGTGFEIVSGTITTTIVEQDGVVAITVSDSSTGEEGTIAVDTLAAQSEVTNTATDQAVAGAVNVSGVVSSFLRTALAASLALKVEVFGDKIQVVTSFVAGGGDPTGMALVAQDATGVVEYQTISGGSIPWNDLTGVPEDNEDLVNRVQNSEWVFGSTTGTDTYLVNLTPALTAYQTGQVFWILFGNANTGAATLNVNSLGAIALRKNVSTALVSGDIPAGAILPVMYDGTNFQVDLKYAGNPTFQQVLIAGATTTQDNTVAGAGFRFTWDNFLRFIVNTTQRIALVCDDGSGDTSNFQVAPASVGTSVGDGVNNSSVSQNSTAFTIELAALNEHQAADLASAATTDLAQLIGNSVTITGTTTITSFGSVDAGARRMVTFAGILTLTHNATSLILPTGANITTAAGDTCIAISLGSGNWIVFDYTRASGNPLNYEENIDWSTGAAVTGYTGALTTNLVYYTRVGKLVTCHIYFNGTSNATTLTFTLPYAAFAEQFFLDFLVTNNGTTSNNPGRLQLTAGSTTATATQNRTGTAWTNSGVKLFIGSFTYLMQ